MTTLSPALLRCLSRPGPSRLASRTLACPDCLRFASTSTSSSFEESPVSDIAAADVVEERSISSRPLDESLKPGYENWLKKIGRTYRYPKEGGSNWIGGHVPFPTNPSFRPPPPLSDILRQMIYLDSLGYDPKSPATSTGLSIIKLSEKYGISKARVDAVLRLKREEEDWKKDGKILQTPFQTEMEKHLSVRHPRSINTPHLANIRTEQQERNTRLLHPSVSLETAAEAQHEAAQKEGDSIDDSAFTRRDTVLKVPGLERGAWEFKDESLVARSFKIAKEDMEKGGDGKVAFNNTEFKTPFSLKEGAEDVSKVVEMKEKKAEGESKEVEIGRSKFRFVDTSGQTGVKPPHSTGGQAVKEYQWKKKLEKRKMNQGK